MTEGVLSTVSSRVVRRQPAAQVLREALLLPLNSQKDHGSCEGVSTELADLGEKNINMTSPRMQEQVKPGMEMR